MSTRKCLSLTLVTIIYTYLVTRVLADFQNDLDQSKVIDFVKNVQNRNLFSLFRQEGQRNFSNPCAGEIYEFVNSLLKKELWALKMLDASSKIPSGFLIGNINDVGMYDECLAVEENKNGTKIRGRHCMYTLDIGLKINLSPQFKKVKPSLSVCVPSKCNSKDVTQLLELIIFKMTNISNIGIKSVTAACSEIDPPDWTAGGITALSAIGLIILFLLGCTFLDLLKLKLNLQTIFVEILSKFSLQRSALQILNTKVNPNSFPVLNGIRFLSISWVVMGHAYLSRTRDLPVAVNKLDASNWIHAWYALYATLGPFSVDSFFTLSGFLVAYLFLKEMSKGAKFNLFKYYLHRYIRLTPAIGMLLVFTIFIIPHLGSGPLWGKINIKPRYSWTIFLYLENVLRLDVRGLGHLWYLAVDMQLFWFSPIILYPLSKKSKIGLAILAASFIASLTSIAVITAVNEYSFDVLAGRGNGMFKEIYKVPHTRAGPWLVGIFFGYIIASKAVRLNRMTAIAGWFCAFISFAFCTLGFAFTQRKDYEYNLVWEIIFSTTSRSVWALGLSWIIFASIKGYGGAVNKFLSLSIFQPLAKLSYSIYLLHPLVQILLTKTARTSVYFSDLEMFTAFLKDLILTTVFAFFFSLFFESPILILEKIIFRKEKIKAKREVLEEVNNGRTKSNSSRVF